MDWARAGMTCIVTHVGRGALGVHVVRVWPSLCRLGCAAFHMNLVRAFSLSACIAKGGRHEFGARVAMPSMGKENKLNLRWHMLSESLS